MTRRHDTPVRFRWIDWNLEKVEGHGLSTEEVEFAWRRGLGDHRTRRDGSFETIGRIPSGRLIQIYWRWNYVPDVWAAEGATRVVFVISAYEKQV